LPDRQRKMEKKGKKKKKKKGKRGGKRPVRSVIPLNSKYNTHLRKEKKKKKKKKKKGFSSLIPLAYEPFTIRGGEKKKRGGGEKGLAPALYWGGAPALAPAKTVPDDRKTRGKKEGGGEGEGDERPEEVTDMKKQFPAAGRKWRKDTKGGKKGGGGGGKSRMPQTYVRSTISTCVIHDKQRRKRGGEEA